MDLKTVHEDIHKFKRHKRVGRGPGSKRGKTATRGVKGQRSRSGNSNPLLKEGGQMQLFRRLPKRGFNNKWKLDFAVVNVVDLGNFEAGAEITLEKLTEIGLTKVPHDRVKILGDGELERNLTVHAHAFSKSAKEKIEKAGGTCVVVPSPHSGPKVKNKMRPRKPKTPLE
jgi:large subunit ribosomal protein L15